MNKLQQLVDALEELRPYLQDHDACFGVYEDARRKLCDVMWGVAEEESTSGHLSDPTVAFSTTGPGSEALL